MTVQQLIEMLSQIEDQQTTVLVKGYEGGVDDIVMSKDDTPETLTVRLNVNTEWYYGRHEIVKHDTPLNKSNTIRAIVIR